MITFKDIDYQVDIPEIVELMKLGLSSKNTQDSFLWKHCENPYGKSIGLLALDQDKIVGLRMFMFWEFRKGEQIIKSIRPVDTIIHPDYRGKGLFKKLTLEGLKKNKEKYDIIFNTPNTNSFPGYIKMGWKEYGKPLEYYKSLLIPSLKYGKRITYQCEDLVNLNLIVNQGANLFKTNISPNYLKWRFKSSEYCFANYQEGDFSLLLIYRERIFKGLKTLILVDYFGPAHLLKAALKGLAFRLKVFIVYYLGGGKNLFKISIKSGASLVVYRDDSKNIHNELDFSLADLEGRL